MSGIGIGISPVFSKAAGVADVLLYDSFVGNNGALINGRTPPVGENAWSDASNACTVQNNRMVCEDGRVPTYDLGSAPSNFMAFFTIIASPTAYQAVRIRHGNENNTIQLAVNPLSGNVEFQCVVGGALHFNLAAPYDASDVSVYYVRIVAVGTTVTAYVQSTNNSIILSGTAHASLTANQSVAVISILAESQFDDIIVIAT